MPTSSQSVSNFLRIALPAVLSLLPASTHAQVNGSILGSATDTSRAAVPGVAVRVTNIDTNLTQDTVTDSLGQYRFLALSVGVRLNPCRVPVRRRRYRPHGQ
jgi:hypothetical protein